MSPPTITLHPKDARAVARGHPWVYREAIVERRRKLKAGSEVILGAHGRPPIGRGIYDPDSPVAVRVWTLDSDESIGPDLFLRRFREALRLRDLAGLPLRGDAYRIVNAEGDRMPGVVAERYGDWLALETQSRSLRGWEHVLAVALHEETDARGIYLRSEKRSSLVAGEPCPDELIVSEPAGRFAVRLAQPGKTGLFADMREARVLLAPLLAGKSFLNLFAHTGAFGGAAAAAGAREVVSVDLGRRYLDWAERNFELAGNTECRHETIAADVFDALKGFAGAERRFDAILCDPPTFSSSRASGAFSVKDSYRPLVRAALRVLEPGGLLACATNWRGIDRDGFVRLLGDAAHAEDVDLRVLTVLGQPADHPVTPTFPEGAYLHFALASTARPA